MRVFKNLDLVEQLGLGISRILEKYDESIFMFTDNLLKTMFISSLSPNLKLGDKLGDLSENRRKIVMLMMENLEISTPQLSGMIGISETAIENNIKFLRETATSKDKVLSAENV